VMVAIALAFVVVKCDGSAIAACCTIGITWARW
jgi:uncharacterized protein (DUF697 family)